MNPVRSEEHTARMAHSERCVSGGQMDQKERDHKEEAGGRATEHTNAILESGPGRTTAWSVARGG